MKSIVNGPYCKINQFKKKFKTKQTTIRKIRKKFDTKQNDRTPFNFDRLT